MPKAFGLPLSTPRKIAITLYIRSSESMDRVKSGRVVMSGIRCANNKV